MSVTNHERPGVYSRYDASTVVKGRGGGGCVGLAALCGTGTAGTLYTFNRYEEAVTAFGGEETLTELVRLLFLNGAAQVKAVPVAEEAGYKAAFSVLEAAEDIAVVVCDSGELTVQQALRDSVKAASEARRERIAVVGGKAGENATALVQRAEGLNSERVVLTARWEKAAARWWPRQWREPSPGERPGHSPGRRGAERRGRAGGPVWGYGDRHPGAGRGHPGGAGGRGGAAWCGA